MILEIAKVRLLAFLVGSMVCFGNGLGGKAVFAQSDPLAGATVIVSPLKARGLAYDAERNLIWVSIGSGGDLSVANRLVALSPDTLQVVQSVLIGSEPGFLDISDNSRRLFVGIDGAAAMRTYDIATDTVGPLVPLLSVIGSPDPSIAQDFATVPNSIRNVIVSMDAISSSATGYLACVGETGVVGTASYVYGPTSIAFSDSNTMVGHDGHNSGATFFNFDYTGSNVVQKSSQGNVSGPRLETAGGIVFSTGGRVVSPDPVLILGTFSGLETGMAVEPVGNGDFCYYFGNGKLFLYDTVSFLRIGNVDLSGITGASRVVHLVRAGSGRLAYVDSNGVVGMISTVPVPVDPPSQISISGTSGDDAVEFDAASGYLMVNGNPVDVGGYRRVHFDGGNGNDTLQVIGVPESVDIAYLDRQRIGFFTSAGFFEGVRCEQIEFEVNDSFDKAAIWDTPGDDNWASNPQFGSLTSTESTLAVRGPAEIYLYATGGVDRAVIAATNGNDRFNASLATGQARLLASNYSLSLSGFAWISVNALGGTDDRVSLIDSDLNDVFYADVDFTRFQNALYDYRTRGFDLVTANADLNGADRAVLKRSGGRLIQNGDNNVIFGPGYRNNARKFETIIIRD